MSPRPAPLRDVFKVDYDLLRTFEIEDVIPTGEESLSDIALKAARWRYIIDQGGSLAVAFGMLEVGGEIDFEREAMATFTPVQRELYNLWKKNENDSIDEENTVHWIQKHPCLIPFLKAVDKVHCRARNAKTQAGNYDPRALQEMLAARKANKAACTILNRFQRRTKSGSSLATRALHTNLLRVQARARKTPH